jgi:hypothetical protein
MWRIGVIQICIYILYESTHTEILSYNFYAVSTNTVKYMIIRHQRTTALCTVRYEYLQGAPPVKLVVVKFALSGTM